MSYAYLKFLMTSYAIVSSLQVILKPDPGNSQELYLGSLAALGMRQVAYMGNENVCAVSISGQRVLRDYVRVVMQQIP